MFTDGQRRNQTLWPCATNLSVTSQTLSDNVRALKVCCRPLKVEDRVQSQANPCGICGENSSIATGFSPRTYQRLSRTMSGLWRFVVGLWPWRTGFSPKPIHVGFVVNTVVLGQVFLPVPQRSPVSVIPPTLHTHSFAYHRRLINLASASVVTQSAQRRYSYAYFYRVRCIQPGRNVLTERRAGFLVPSSQLRNRRHEKALTNNN